MIDRASSFERANVSEYLFCDLKRAVRVLTYAGSVVSVGADGHYLSAKLTETL